MVLLTASLNKHYILKTVRSVLILTKFTSNFLRRSYFEARGENAAWASNFAFKIRTYSTFTEIHFAI